MEPISVMVPLRWKIIGLVTGVILLTIAVGICVSACIDWLIAVLRRP